MVKDDTILMLAALGVGAAILYKPLQKTGEGIAQAAGGLGSGIQQAAGGLGSGISDIGSSAGEIAQGVSSPFGYMDRFFDQLPVEAPINALESLNTMADVEERRGWMDIVKGAISMRPEMQGINYLYNKFFKKDKKSTSTHPTTPIQDLQRAGTQLESDFLTGKSSIQETLDRLRGARRIQPVDTIPVLYPTRTTGKYIGASTVLPRIEARNKKKEDRNRKRESPGSSKSLSRVKNYDKLSSVAKRRLREAGYS
jgi:hypothetical protein